MALQDKYRSVLDMGQKFDAKDGDISVKDGVLQIKGTVETQRQKDLMWDEIKRIGGENPNDLMADIKVSNTVYYDKYTVKSGDSLSKIADEYFGDPMKYKEIFEANSGTLDDPNKIYPGQELIIPFAKNA